MKEINGTISLAYVEEDNKQRVIFRVIPLCTREGCTFRGGAEDFPDEGSLRIVPDKREQSTFKERMRALGGLCVIHLLSDGKELLKVRQNRNYAPEQGERNQFAIYSDVICEFTEDGCFEVVELGAAAQSALTPKVLVHKNKVLYGPVDKEAADTTDLSGLKPFGNDRFLLHMVDSPFLGSHLIYWDPEATLTWRQRRSSLRRRDKAGADEAPAAQAPAGDETDAPFAAVSALSESAYADLQPLPEEKAAPRAEKATGRVVQKPAAIEKTSRIKLDPRTRRVERSAQALREEEAKRDAEKAVELETVPLPIGTRLDILDAELPFDQQISRLAQPLSEGANRLTAEPEALPEAEEEEPQEAVARFSGTPLMKASGQISRTTTHPEPMHHVVDQQLRGRRDGTLGSEIGQTAYGLLDNPIENLQGCMEYVWQNADMREQAISALMQNESFVRDMLRAFRQGGLSTQAATAAQEQLAEIEAERLSLLMQLETARANEKKFRDEAIASLNRKRREEAEHLEKDIRRLESVRQELAEAARAFSSGVAAQATDFLAAHMRCLTGAGDQRVLLSPVLGRHYAQQELAEKLRVHMNDSGFSLNEDDAMSLLIDFSLYDAVCFRAPAMAEAQLFAQVLLESFGLQSVSAAVPPGSYVEMVSLLPEDTLRTPTVTVQFLGTETMSVFGHKTLFLTDMETVPSDMDMLLPYPVVSVPALSKRAFGRPPEWTALEPAALSSFAAIRADVHPMLDEAEKWFDRIKHELSQTELSLPDTMFVSMRRFIEVASRKVRGGFLAAADTAMCHWVVPMLTVRKVDEQKLADVMAGLPRALELLGIR